MDQTAAQKQTEIRGNDASRNPDLAKVDRKLEVHIIPVSDVERAREFYKKLAWRLDVTPPGVVQLTPHGSACSIQFGQNLTSAAPGSARAYLIVSDIQAAREALINAGVEVGEIFHLGLDGPVSGPDPEHRTYRSRALFAGPDGNGWIPRPGFPDASTWYAAYTVAEQAGTELPT